MTKEQQIPAAVLRRDDEGGPLPQMVAQRREQLRQEREAPPSSNERLQSIHTICGLIRSQRYAGVDEREVDCKRCSEREDTSYGPGTRGCFLLALECYQAAHGRRSFTGEPFVPAVETDGLAAGMRPAPEVDCKCSACEMLRLMRPEEPAEPRIKPGDRVQNEVGHTGVVMTVGDTRACVQYDDGNAREPLLTNLRPLKASGRASLACIHRDGCRKFPACMTEARCCGRDASIPETR